MHEYPASAIIWCKDPGYDYVATYEVLGYTQNFNQPLQIHVKPVQEQPDGSFRQHEAPRYLNAERTHACVIRSEFQAAA